MPPHASRVQPRRRGATDRPMPGLNENGVDDCLATAHAVEPFVEEERADLLAAAPELLEACKRLLDVFEMEKEACNLYSEQQRIAKKAIAKATQ